jgi:hypothetical protein
MGRRNARNSRGGGGASGVTAAALEAIVRGYTPYSWIEADSVTPAATNVASMVDRVTAGTGIRAITANHALEQATGAQQVALPVASATLNNQLAFTFAGAQRYDSNSPASSWKMHDGVGWEAFTWFVWPAAALMPMIATGSVGGLATQRSIVWSAYDFGTPTVELRIGNATATPVCNSSVASAGATGANYTNFRYVEGATPEWNSLYKDISRASGASGAAPDGGDPNGTLRVGADRAAANSMSGVWGGYLIWNRILTSPERTMVRAYLQVKFGAG